MQYLKIKKLEDRKNKNKMKFFNKMFCERKEFFFYFVYNFKQVIKLNESNRKIK